MKQLGFLKGHVIPRKTISSITDELIDDLNSKQELPPVRNSLQKKKKKRQKPKDTSVDHSKPKRISGYDFRAWDKFDVDKALEDVEGDDNQAGSSSEYETDEEWEIERQIQQANVYKDEGNLFFKQKKFDKAIECYTRAIDCDPTNAILPANRAMALLKQKKYGGADVDCTTSISLDPTYVKAYSRRACARIGLGRLEDADRDFDKVLVLEPGNKFALAEKEKIQQKLKPQVKETTPEQSGIDSDTGILHPIFKPPSERSKKPLRRIKIQEVGLDEGENIRQAISKTESLQSETKKLITEKDASSFEHFVAEKPLEEPRTSDQSISSESASVIKEFRSDERQECNSAENESSQHLVGDKETPPKRKPHAKNVEPSGSASHTSPDSSPRIPGIPTTSFQFQADLKAIKKSPEKVFHYLKAIDPSNYITLFGQAFDADILTLILSTLKGFFLPADLDVYPILENLTHVKRFAMTVMFMSAKEKGDLHELLTSVKEIRNYSEEDISKLAKSYEL